MLRYR